jgi:hypothetical protein
MKKGLVLATIFALCSTMMVSAKEFNDARWQWFYSNSDYTGKVDLNTLSYDPSTDTAQAWAVWVQTRGLQELREYDIHFANSSVTIKHYYIYKNGSDTAINEGTANNTRTPAPGSGGEALIASVKGLVGRDTKLADYKKQQADEAQVQEQKRIEEQQAAEKKAKHERNRDILRGIFGI